MNEMGKVSSWGDRRELQIKLANFSSFKFMGEAVNSRRIRLNRAAAFIFTVT
jgi:hypothetical protein